jgi:penicillin-insensitive murein endopeptidase
MLDRFHILPLVILFALSASAYAQDIGTVQRIQSPPLANPSDPNIPAKELFGRKPEPAPMSARSIGKYSRGCLAGGMMLPVNGPTWQVMRLSRNRNWAHPNMIKVLERFASKVPKIGWPGLLVGDLTQPRGGPMLTSHVSHQIGLDADVWFTPMPDHELTRQEREEKMATNIVNDEWNDVRPEIWSPVHIALLKTVADDPQVERVLVNYAIKKALCRDVTSDRNWLTKMRIVYGHNYHFHIRIKCPADSPDCTPDLPTPSHDTCAEELAFWTANDRYKPKPQAPGPERYQLRLSDLPAACREVIMAPRAGAAGPDDPPK